MKSILIRVCLLCLSMPTATMAFANDEEELIDEVIVTATRRETAIMDTPQSIQAIAGETLELPIYNDMNKVFNLIPGATAWSNKPPAKEGIQMRGSGISQAGASDGMSPVGYYVDDIPYVDISTPVPPPISTFDLDRIEVLRGPQGTSYGQDSSGGSVIMRTAAVDLQNFGYKVRAGVLDVNGVDGTGYTVGGVINLPLVEDVFGVRLSFLQEEDPGYGEVANRPDIDNPLENTRDSFRVKAYWLVNNDFDIEVTHSQWNTDYNFLPGSQIRDSSTGTMVLNSVSTPMLLELFPDGELENDFEIEWTTFLAKYRFGSAELTYSAGRVDTPKKETNSEFEFDLGFGPLFAAVVFNQPAESTTHELRLVSTSDSDLQWLVGAFHMEAESDSRGFTQTPAFFISEQLADPIDAETTAFYGEIEYAINDEWSLLGGLRFHDEEREQTSEYALGFAGEPTFGPFSFAFPTTVEEMDFDHTSYRIGVTWTPNENGLVYLTQSSANRAPIMLPQSDRIALEAAGVEAPGDTDASEMINTELGTKWTLLDGRMQLELVYAHSDWRDLPIWASLNIPPQPISVAVGGTDAEVETWEVIMTWAVNDDLTVSYSGAFTDTEVTDVPENVAAYPPAVRDGGELFNYSPTTHNISVSYSRELANNWTLLASADYVTREAPDGINVFDFFSTAYVPADEDYRNLALSLGATKGPWTLSFSVNNATDEDDMYLPRTENVVGGPYALLPQPRTMAFQVVYDKL